MTTDADFGYLYYVAYVSTTSAGLAYGATEIRLRRPVRSFQDVNVLRDMLIDEGHRNPVVMSFSQYDSSEPTPARPAPSRATS